MHNDSGERLQQINPGVADDHDGRHRLKKTGRWVVKIGSALLTNDGKGLDIEALKPWVAQLAAIRREGVELVLVSSGAIAEGMSRLGWVHRPKEVHELQAAAALGQMGLVQAWETEFKAQGFNAAQILLTHDDLSDRKRYLNARGTIRTLVRLGVIPVVNENDTVATEEIRFGDNDTLAALVANLIEADVLIILTDQSGLFDADPRRHSDASLIGLAYANDRALDQMASGSAGTLGSGGMYTKLRAARLAGRSGAATVIVGGRIPDVLARLRQGDCLGTLLLPDQERWLARKQWLAGHLKTKGRLILDDGAVKVLLRHGRSLLAVGVKSIDGEFRRGEMVACCAMDGTEVARGLVNYDAEEALLLCGKGSDQIESILGYMNEAELIHRDNLVLID
jgi:glutamate 5-kinase